MKHLCLILLFVIPLTGKTQTSISGEQSDYFEVTSVTNGSNTVTCQTIGLSNLNAGDKIVIIQMTGAGMDRTDAAWQRASGTISINNMLTGRYEYLTVNTVNTGTGEVTFTANLKRTYDAFEKLQLVKIVEDSYVSVDGIVSAQPWNGSTGGVLAIVAYKKLTLNANIDLSGNGYPGASPVSYSLDCYPNFDTLYFKDGLNNKGGIKGTGVLTDTFSYNIGMGNALNGGGGGHGYFGGGGGGSNYNAGGQGGVQTESCGTFAKSEGGVGLGNNFYIRAFETNPDERYAIAMGGGGGSSNQYGGDVATAGARGGGIVIILTDTLEGNANIISANGNSVVGVATAGAGGGGGGGVVVLDATSVSSSVQVNITGGTGGNVETNCAGAGGGGSGGVFWHNGASVLPGITTDLSGGNGGIGDAGCTAFLVDGTLGEDGERLVNYEPLLNGFSFNAISGIDTICQGLEPDEIYGSTPKGGGPFTFDWISSTDNIVWTSIVGGGTKNYKPDALNETTYYKRVVTDGDGVNDTSLSVEIFVWDSLENNILQLRDTLCYNDEPGLLQANTVIGAGGASTYSYIWETRTDASPWTQRTEWNDIDIPTEGNLTETTYYRRTVNSVKVCTDVSKPDTITVLSLISDNLFPAPDTTICKNLGGGTLKPNRPTGGDGTYTYAWLSSSDDVNYTPIAGADSVLHLGNLAQTTHYKRIVYSGSDDACIDTTEISRSIEVLELISGNVISTDSLRYCYNDTPLVINGEVLSGAQSGDYRITWWLNEGAGWNIIPGEVSGNYQPGALTDSTVYRRTVISGAFNACNDTSNAIDVDVIPHIVNDLVSPDENICENAKPVAFTENEASGGAEVFNYLWLEKPVSSSNWTPASTAEGVNTSEFYTPTNLTETTEFRRRVLSHICADTSSSITIIVYPKIENNNIVGGASQFTCYNSLKQFIGSTPTGGKEGAGYNYYWQSSTDQIVWGDAAGKSDSIHYLTEPMALAEYFRRMVTSGEAEQCVDISPAVHLQINELPSGDIVSMIDTLCAGSEIVIDYNVSGGSGPWTFELGETTTIHIASDLQNTSGQIIFPIEQSADIKALNIIDDSLCYADLSSNTGLVNAMVYEVPVANAGGDFEDCGLSTVLNAVPSVGIGMWTSNDGVFSDANNPKSNVDVSAYGPSSFTWTETNWRECVDQDVVNVIFYEQPVEVNAGEDIFLKYEFSTQLNATPEVLGEGHWKFKSGTGIFDDSTKYNTVVTVENVGDYVLEWVIENGTCAAISDSILLTVFDIELFGGFSPNGDGINELYTIDLSEGGEAKFIVLDRNGNQVRTIDGVSIIQWDGTNEGGDQVPPGTYFYILQENGRPNRTGYIELRR